MEDTITISRTELKELIKQEVAKKVKEIVDQVEILPTTVKARHIDPQDTGLHFNTDSSGYKQIGIGGWNQYLYQGTSAGEIRIYDTLVCDGDIIAVGSTYGLRIYTAAIPLVFGDSAGGYDTNLYRSAANTLATDDDLKFTATAKGPLLVDRTTAAVYRLKVDSGALGVEAV